MRTTLALLIILAVLATPAAARADSAIADATLTANIPPSRPLPFTAEQAAALEDLSHHPQLAVAPDTRAAYSPKASKIVTEASAVGFYAGYFSTLAIILIAAAPL